MPQKGQLRGSEDTLIPEKVQLRGSDKACLFEPACERGQECALLRYVWFPARSASLCLPSKGKPDIPHFAPCVGVKNRDAAGLFSRGLAFTRAQQS